MNPPTTSTDPLIGTIVGSFKIIKAIGRGGMGTVYLGEHTVIGSKVAIKTLHERLAVDEGLVSRFYAEARAANMIGHENIVSVFDMNVVPPHRYYLVMEYLEGKPLNALLRKPVPAEISIPILLQVCDALQAAHDAGIVHRDLKPENIFLITRGRKENFVKVVDFGLAKLLEPDIDTTQTAAGLIVGTPEFMSPEQANSTPVDGRADIYALGCIAWLMATARLPFPQKGLADLIVAHRQQMPADPHTIVPSVPIELSKAIMKAVAKRPGDRYQSARAFAQALEGVLTYDVTPPPYASPTHRVIPSPPTITRPMADPAAERSPRFEVAYDAVVVEVGGKALGKATVRDLSKGGAFIDTPQQMPPLFSRLKVTLVESSIDLLAEVVRHVAPDQAKAWGMQPGVGVQFVDMTPELRETLSRMVTGMPVKSSSSAIVPTQADNPEAEIVLARFRRRLDGDHYQILGAAIDSDFDALRASGRELQNELLKIAELKLSTPQRSQLSAAQERIKLAVTVLGTPAQRAEVDANRGNYRGVSRCLHAGLTATELERLRSSHLQARPGVSGSAHVKLLASKALEARNQWRAALEACESALVLDPLNLNLHHRYAQLQLKVRENEKPK